MVTLLDVNVLIALAWANHQHHDAAHHWFASQRSGPWATCPLTQVAFVRISANPRIVDATVPAAIATGVLLVQVGGQPEARARNPFGSGSLRGRQFPTN